METWMRALDNRRMKVCRSKTQDIDFNFLQSSFQGREPMEIIEEYRKGYVT